tara:strand:+ start:322 stop:597 length:276 start_codon:yes stop_codon:yes gene_type:complete
MKCIDKCRTSKKACKKSECRMWVDHAPDLNCTYETVKKNGSLSLREAAKRLNISFVRVKQIEDEALIKLLKALRAQTGLEEEYLRELLICE